MKTRPRRRHAYDGKWVLRTNTTLPAAEVALKYKQLWMVEHLFRSAKSLLETRPVFHKYDRTIRGHVFCSFLALVLRRALQDRLDAEGILLRVGGHPAVAGRSDRNGAQSPSQAVHPAL